MELFGSYPPQGLVIPKYHGPSNPREYDDNSYFLLTPDSKGYLTIEGEAGAFKFGKKDFPRLFPSKWNWTFSQDNGIDCLFKFFKTDELVDLDLLGYLTFDGYKIFWIPGTAKVRLQKGDDVRSSKYLVNIAKFTPKTYIPKSLDDLRAFVETQWKPLNHLLPLNPISMASTSKDLLLDDGRGPEFSLYNYLDQETIKFFHETYIGPRMESRCLGTVEGLDNIDMIKAYLKALGRCPSLDRRNILKIVKGKTYYEEAHPGSSYEIKVTVPRTYSRFPPLPLSNGHILYPHGTFTTRVAKPYIDSIIKAGDIPFEILDSRQVIPLGPPVYPFKELAEKLEAFEDTAREHFPLIDLKMLHCTIHGHMMHFHQVIQTTSLQALMNPYYETSQDYNPINACAVQAMVAQEIWKITQETDSEAYRIDAVSGRNLPTPKGFRKEKTGLMTFLTPAFKDKPGATLYRDLIYKSRDFPGVRICLPHRLSLKQSIQHPRSIGVEENICVQIEPLGGNRLVDKPKRVGELLERRLPTTIPMADETLPQMRGPDVTWLEEQLSRFPQTRI